MESTRIPAPPRILPRRPSRRSPHLPEPLINWFQNNEEAVEWFLMQGTAHPELFSLASALFNTGRP